MDAPEVTPRCLVDEVNARYWLASTRDGDWMPTARRLGVDATFREGMPAIGTRAGRLVSEAHTDGVLWLPKHAIGLWQVGDDPARTAFLVTVRLPNGTWLAMGDFSPGHLLGAKAGADAAAHLLRTVAHEVTQELRGHAQRYPPQATPTADSAPHTPRGFVTSPTRPADLPTPPQPRQPPTADCGGRRAHHR